MSSRRAFMGQVAMGLSSPTLFRHWDPSEEKDRERISGQSLKLGLAGYTFHNIPMETGIAITQRVAINAISIKDFYLPLNSSPEKMTEVLGRFQAAGIQVYAAGVIYMKTRDEVDQAFEYVGRAGIPMIIGVPTHELVGYAAEKVKSTGIRLAIHNHGPNDKLYPGPKESYELVRNLDKGMGICLDVGHCLGAGQDPVAAVTAYADRLFDVHIKDLSGNPADDHSVPVGRGVMDIPGLVRALEKIQFQGRCSIEYEVQETDILPGLAESVGFFRGVIRATNS